MISALQPHKPSAAEGTALSWWNLIFRRYSGFRGSQRWHRLTTPQHPHWAPSGRPGRGQGLGQPGQGIFSHCPIPVSLSSLCSQAVPQP